MLTNTISFYCLMTIFIDSSWVSSLNNPYKKAPYKRGFSVINLYTVTALGTLKRVIQDKYKQKQGQYRQKTHKLQQTRQSAPNNYLDIKITEMFINTGYSLLK